jgi:hypothetical protein
MLLELIGVGARATRILDFLLAHHDVGQVARNLAARAPEVHLKGQRVLAAVLLDDPLQRRIRDEASVPVELALDLHRRKAGRKRSARQHVLGPDRMRFIVEVHEIAGAHIHRADTEAHLAGIDPVEVDKPLERALQEPGFVKARGLKSAVRVQPGSGLPKREKARGTREDGVGRTNLTESEGRVG